MIARLILLISIFSTAAIPCWGQKTVDEIVSFRRLYDSDTWRPEIVFSSQSSALNLDASSRVDSATETKGVIKAPKGFTICRVSLVSRYLSLPDAGTTFNGTIKNQMSQLAYYAAGSRAKARVQFSLVREGVSTADCMHDGPVWQCGNNTPAGKNSCGENQSGGVLGNQGFGIQEVGFGGDPWNAGLEYSANQKVDLQVHNLSASGSENTGIVVAPQGYKICKASLLRKLTDLVGPGTTFNGSLQNQLGRLAFYSANDDQGRKPIAHVVFYIIPVASPTTECMHDGPVWQCGKNTPAGMRDCGEQQAGGVIK